MQKQKTLADLKVGDEVALQVGMGDYYIYPITDISPKGIITISIGTRYHSNGTPLSKGEKWNRPRSIEPATDKIRAVVRKKTLVSRMSGLNYNHWKAMDLATLEAVNRIVFGKEEQQ